MKEPPYVLQGDYREHHEQLHRCRVGIKSAQTRRPESGEISTYHHQGLFRNHPNHDLVQQI